MTALGLLGDSDFETLVEAISAAFTELETRRFLNRGMLFNGKTWNLYVETRYQCRVLYLRQPQRIAHNSTYTAAWIIREGASPLYEMFAEWMVATSKHTTMSQLATLVANRTHAFRDFLKAESRAMHELSTVRKHAREAFAINEMSPLLGTSKTQQPQAH